MQHMKDPAAGVPRQLLPHMHLVSRHRYPLTNHMTLETVVAYLTEAPKIVRDIQPVQWQFLDAPPDGSVFLVWQPHEYLGNSFASDGYVWGDVEHAFNSEARGYTVEMFMHRSGYHYPNEPVAAHSRRRYRLSPAKNPAPGLPPPDTSLWIVHYTRADRNDHVASRQIPIGPEIRNVLSQRQYLQSQGQLARKEFMLHDRANWPTITIPVPDRGHRRMGSAPSDPSLEEEEDVSRGDMLDFMTPRDVSKLRYEQHHEWMEEIMNSPYATKQIIPTDLGLGRKGELESLTRGFFEAPTAVLQETSGDVAPTRVGKMNVAKADEFTRMAAQKVADMKAELEKIKQRHAKRMAKLERTTLLNSAEKRLRTASNIEDNTGEWEAAGTADGDQRSKETVDDIVQEVEASWRTRIEPLSTVTCIQAGGLLQTKPDSTLERTATVSINTPQKETPLDDRQTDTKELGISQATTPAQQGQSPLLANPPRPMSSSTGTPSGQTPAEAIVSNVQSPQKVHDTQDDHNLPSLDGMDVDMEMAGLDDQMPAGQGDEEGSNEWVMVDEDGNGNGNVRGSSPEFRPALQERDSSGATEANLNSSAPGNGIHSLNTARAGDPNPNATAMNDSSLDSSDFDIHGDFDNVDVDTAGDALADYGADYDAGHEDLKLEEMDDSAFGDAFHPPDDLGMTEIPDVP